MTENLELLRLENQILALELQNIDLKKKIGVQSKAIAPRDQQSMLGSNDSHELYAEHVKRKIANEGHDFQGRSYEETMEWLQSGGKKHK